MDEKTVLVTGIGGNVGQGIIRNIRATNYTIKVVGTNVDVFSAGNHLCDIFYTVPYAYHEHFISKIKEIVIKEAVDLIVPSTDFEVYYLSKFKLELPCDIAVSDEEATSIFLDKYLTYRCLSKNNIPFALSLLPSEYNKGFEEIILKPRKGRGSRDILINPTDYGSYSDETYMIQELHKGIEITTAFYITKLNKLHGLITFERVLENGATTNCKVITKYDEKLRKILMKLISKLSIKGSANIQAIVNENGDIIPFEINCRISGTNSIRSNFGFEDVKYTLQEWLFDMPLSTPKIKKGIATRILMDVIYPENQDFSQASNNSSKYFLY